MLLKVDESARRLVSVRGSAEGIRPW
jgi:hypothetical protein